MHTNIKTYQWAFYNIRSQDALESSDTDTIHLWCLPILQTSSILFVTTVLSTQPFCNWKEMFSSERMFYVRLDRDKIL